MAICKVSESYKVVRAHKYTFRKHKLRGYEQRIPSFKALEKIFILILDGKLKCSILIGNYRQRH